MTVDQSITAAATAAVSIAAAFYILNHHQPTNRNQKSTASSTSCTPPNQPPLDSNASSSMSSPQPAIVSSTEQIMPTHENPAKLYYYNATGRANHIRLTLAAANIPFVEENPKGYPPSADQKQKWRKLGRNTTTNVPMLQLGDKYYTQSSAILRMVARKGGLMPDENNYDAMYTMDKLIADAEDFRLEAYKSFVLWGASDRDVYYFINKVAPLHFENMERQLKEAGTDFYLGDKLTVADVAIYDAVVNFGTSRIPGDSLKNFAVLKEWVKRVEANPGISSYLKSEQYKSLAKFEKFLTSEQYADLLKKE